MHRTPSPRQSRCAHRGLPLSLAFGALAALLAPAALRAQALPPTPPTSQPASQPATLPPQAAAAPAAATPPVSTPNHAEVTYAGGQLQVRADNSSLNQILRSISHRTGLKITGGVEEQRVFGNYGPGPVSAVLATLLDGTNTNIFLRAGDATNPPELVLTQRGGGAAPPEPTSPAYAMYDDSTDRDAPVAPPASHSATGPTHPVAASPAAPPATVPAATPDAKTPLTPEMVMQQLLKIQQQQAQQKKDLDDTVQKEQIEQQQRLKKPTGQNPPSQPRPSSQPATPTSPQ